MIATAIAPLDNDQIHLWYVIHRALVISILNMKYDSEISILVSFLFSLYDK